MISCNCQLSRCVLLLLVDNKAVEGAFAKKMATKWQTQSLIRKVLSWAASTRSYFYVYYINTKDNFLADPLSRLDLLSFFRNANRHNILVDTLPYKFNLWLWDEHDHF